MNAHLEQNVSGGWFKPGADVVEKADGWHIYLDVPGVTKESLAIDLADKVLTVAGKTFYSTDDVAGSGGAAGRSAHIEFGGGEYKRAFALSDEVDFGAIEASLKNGVLDVRLTKTVKASPRRINVSTN